MYKFKEYLLYGHENNDVSISADWIFNLWLNSHVIWQSEKQIYIVFIYLCQDSVQCWCQDTILYQIMYFYLLIVINKHGSSNTVCDHFYAALLSFNFGWTDNILSWSKMNVVAFLYCNILWHGILLYPYIFWIKSVFAHKMLHLMLRQ